MGLLGQLFGKKAESGERKPAASMPRAKDPVCRMDVDPKTAADKSEYHGQTYYFCAVGCKKTFDTSPEKYIKGKEAGTPGHMGHHHHHM